MIQLRRSRFFIALLLLATPLSSFAHSPSTSYIRVGLDRNAASLWLSFNWSEDQQLAAFDDNRDGRLEAAEAHRHKNEIARRLATVLFIAARDGVPLAARVEQVTVDGPHLEITSTVPLPADRSGLRLRSRLPEILSASHISLVKISGGPEVEEAVLDRNNPDAEFSAPGLGAQAAAFLWLGVRHIFTGYDHVLFLVALLLAGGSTIELVKIVTSFTVAHSITLALAALAVVMLPVRFVESAIALSICYVAAENMVLPHAGRRWVITFFFGLIHGFGFSTILRELELPRASLATSLVFFNLGVETGQVAIVLLFLPLLALLRRSAHHRQIVIALSSAILIVGGYWFVQRTL